MLKTTQKYIFLALVFALPLIFNPWGFDMYEIPKNTLLKVAIATLTILHLVEKFRSKRTNICLSQNQLYAILAFLTILALSLIFAIRPNVSFWGTYARQGGVINMLFYVLLFLTSLDFLQKKTHQILTLKTLSFSGLLVSLYALLQWAGLDIFSTETTAIFSGRSFASLGNPTALGAFLLFPIWGEIALLHLEKKQKSKHLALAAIMLLALLSTVNRASILALLASGFLYLLYTFRKNKKLLAGIFAGLLILLTIFIAAYSDNLRSISSRFSTWHSSTEIIVDNPILGYGLESFPYLFESYVKPEFFEHEDYYNLVDRPHNEFLEMWIHLGLLGFLFYLALIAYSLKIFFTAKKPIPRFASLAILSLFATNFFSFSLITHYAFLVIFLALIAAENSSKITFKPSWPNKIPATLLGLLLTASIVLNICIFTADLQIKSAYKSLNTLDLTAITSHLEKATDLAPFYSSVHMNAFTLYYPLAEVLGDEELLALAVSANASARELSHSNLKSLLNEARLFRLIEDPSSAEEVYKTIYDQVGIHPLLYEHWADLYYEQSLFDHAALIYDEYLNLLPNDWQAPIETPEEMTEDQRIFWKNHPDFLKTLEQVITTYESTGQTKKADEILESLK
jgi:O-antigen ligase